MICRYCDKPVNEVDSIITRSYWGGTAFHCHVWCKQAGEKQEAFDCQTIDADCNDCRHFKRGLLATKFLSCMENGMPGLRKVNLGFFYGHCLKFDRLTIAQPNKWTGMPCFEHRRATT